MAIIKLPTFVYDKLFNKIHLAMAMFISSGNRHSGTDIAMNAASPSMTTTICQRVFTLAVNVTSRSGQGSVGRVSMYSCHGNINIMMLSLGTL